MSRFWRATLSQRLAIYALLTVLVLAGLVAVGALPQAVYPDLDLSRVNVRAERGDLAPSLVQSSLTRPLERELSAVIGTQQIAATSTQGAADITLTFDPRVASTNVALQRVSTAVSAIEASLPKGTAVRIQQVGTNLFPVLSYAVTSDALNQIQLREAIAYQVRPQLIGLPGVALVTVLGGDVREYLVSVDPERLAAHGLTLAQLTSAIAQTNQIEAVGHADSGYVRSTILASGMAHSVQDVANIPLAGKDGRPLTVGSVASVLEAPAPPAVRASTQGKDAVLVNVFAQPRASYVSVAHTAASAMTTALSALPDVRANKFWDQSILVSAAIENLRDAILIGLALSTLVLLFFLRNWRMTLIAGSVIPLTIVITFGAMRLLGQGLNLMTLGGLAIGVGLVIDDAIVVVENIARHMARNDDRRAAVITAVGEIAGPMTTSTLTTIVVFAPLSLLSGIPGAFFSALSISLTVALIVSLILAFVFTPNVALQAVRTAGGSAQQHRFVGWVNRRYTPLLTRALERRTPVILGALVVLGATVWLGMHLGTDFLPALDEGAFELTYTLAPGTSLPETQRVAHEIQGAIDADPAVARSAGLIGASMTLINTDTPQGTTGGTMRATLKAVRSEGIRTVMDRIGDRIRAVAPNAQFSTRQLLQDSLSDLANQQAPIEIRIFGPQQSALIPLASDVASRIGQIAGVSGAFSGVIYHNPSIVVRADPASSAFGVSAAQLDQDEPALFGGDVVSEVIRNPLVIPVRVRYDLPLDPNPADLGNIPYVTPNGSVQPLSRLATFTTSPPQSDIQELNARQYLPVTAQINGSNLGAIVAGIKQQLAQIDWPPGYTYQIAGSYALQQQSFRQFATAIVLSIALVLLVMIAQFRSLLQPLAILTAVPLAAFGAALALFLTHISINVSSLMGVILLVGLVVKNGILLLEYAAANERRGHSVQSALITAGQIRLRPILMTTLTALLGMLPLAFGLGSGSELLQPLAVAVIGGLAFSTLFTLFVVPVVFALFADRKGRDLIVAAIVLAFVMVPVHADAQEQPLSLNEAIAAAFAVSSTTQATDAVRNAANLAARVKNLPRTGIATIVGSEPEGGGTPTRYFGSEEFTVDLGSAVGRLGALQAAQAELAQAAAMLAGTRRATVSAVLGSFFTVGSDEALASAQAETVSLATRTMTAAVERHRTGVTGALDVERARAVLAAAEADQAATTETLAGDRVALATLVGKHAPILALPSLPSILPDIDTVTDAAIKADPAVAAAQAALAANEAAVLLARAQVRPGLSIGAGIGIASQGGLQSVGPAADIRFTVPFGSGFTKVNSVAADAATLVAKANLEQARREAIRSALHAWTATRSDLARLPGLRTASDAARQVAEADLAGYRLGAVSSADLVAAQTQAATARAALETATVQALQHYAELQFEIGALG